MRRLQLTSWIWNNRLLTLGIWQHSSQSMLETIKGNIPLAFERHGYLHIELCFMVQGDDNSWEFSNTKYQWHSIPIITLTHTHTQYFLVQISLEAQSFSWLGATWVKKVVEWKEKTYFHLNEGFCARKNCVLYYFCTQATKVNSSSLWGNDNENIFIRRTIKII